MMKRPTMVAIALAGALAAACDPPQDPTGIAPSLRRDGDGGRRGAWSPWSEPVNLGPTINTSQNDIQAALSKDGLSLYFVATNRAGGAGGNDIWVSQRDCADGPWGTPVNVAALNTTFVDGGPELSDDERLLFFHSSRPGGPGGNDIYVSRRANPKDDFGWEGPTLLGNDVNTPAVDNVGDYLRGNLYFNRGPPDDIYYAPVIREGQTRGPAVPIAELNDPAANDGSATVRTDEREVFFSSTRAGTLSPGDIWVSTRRNVHDAWSTPENLGLPVNSAFGEATPSLSPDGRTLLFDSTRPGGVGGRDIWMSIRTQRGHHGDHGDDDDDDDKACRGHGDDDGDDG